MSARPTKARSGLRFFATAEDSNDAPWRRRSAATTAGARWRASSTTASTVRLSVAEDADGAATAAAGSRAAIKVEASRTAPSLFIQSMLLETAPPGFQHKDRPETLGPAARSLPMLGPSWSGSHPRDMS